MNKQELRKLFKDKRENLTPDQINTLSHEITQNFITNLLPTLPTNSIFSLYLDSYQEVKTTKIAHYFQEQNIPFSYPKITKLHAPLQFILHEKDQTFTKSTFFPQIFEPKNGQIVDPDVLIVPLLAFDMNFSRLGMGGGFYDRTIYHLQQHKKVTTIGLAYDFQCSTPSLPFETTDQKLDFVITQNQIFSRA